MMCGCLAVTAAARRANFNIDTNNKLTPNKNERKCIDLSRGAVYYNVRTNRRQEKTPSRLGEA